MIIRPKGHSKLVSDGAQRIRIGVNEEKGSPHVRYSTDRFSGVKKSRHSCTDIANIIIMCIIREYKPSVARVLHRRLLRSVLPCTPSVASRCVLSDASMLQIPTVSPRMQLRRFLQRSSIIPAAVKSNNTYGEDGKECAAIRGAEPQSQDPTVPRKETGQRDQQLYYLLLPWKIENNLPQPKAGSLCSVELMPGEYGYGCRMTNTSVTCLLLGSKLNRRCAAVTIQYQKCHPVCTLEITASECEVGKYKGRENDKCSNLIGQCQSGNDQDDKSLMYEGNVEQVL
uniref:Uncharacterized protein n=1 Tax=Setaria digitata TaxID=48799 RepID=A0A915PID1_9BILA